MFLKYNIIVKDYSQTNIKSFIQGNRLNLARQTYKKSNYKN